MNDKDNKLLEKEYIELIRKIKKELPNIVLPSMGILNEEEVANINGKDFVISNKEV